VNNITGDLVLSSLPTIASVALERIYSVGL
jgi:hypothetical protein